MAIIGGFMVPHPPLIVPAVGRGSEKEISDTVNAYNAAAQKIAELKPKTIIITSPHSIMYRDYFHISPGTRASGSFGQFGASQVQITADYDTELAEEICRKCTESRLPHSAVHDVSLLNNMSAVQIPAGTDGERNPQLDHATMIPLYFINNFYTDYKVVRIGLSGLPFSMHWEFGVRIAAAVESLNRRTVFVASGDLSHVLKEDGPYGFKKEGPVYDEKIMKTMGSGNLRELIDYDEDFCETAAQCGHRSFTIMGGALEETENMHKSLFTAQKLSYEGPFGVGYGICTYL